MRFPDISTVTFFLYHSINVVPGVLYVLNHSKKWVSPRRHIFLLVMSSCCLYCSPCRSPLTLPPPNVFSCPHSLVFLPLMSLRLFLKSHSGTAGRQSSLVIHGADFSTKDMDNDNCLCKCALMLTGGQSSHAYVTISIDHCVLLHGLQSVGTERNTSAFVTSRPYSRLRLHVSVLSWLLFSRVATYFSNLLSVWLRQRYDQMETTRVTGHIQAVMKWNYPLPICVLVAPQRQ